MRLDGFNADEQAPADSYEAIPAGWYKCIIDESEEKETKKGDGSYLQFVMVVAQGEHEGAKLWARFNLNNPSTKAVEIAKRELGGLCRAVSIPLPKDSSDLHGKALMVLVATKPYNGSFTNEVKKFKDRDYLPTSDASATVPTTAPSSTSGDALPWNK